MISRKLIDQIIDQEFPNPGIIRRTVERWALKQAYTSGFSAGREGRPNSNATRPVSTTKGFQALYEKGYQDGQYIKAGFSTTEVNFDLNDIVGETIKNNSNPSSSLQIENKSYDAFSFMGWVLGGLSLINLIEDLTPVKLLGKLEKWIDAYNLLTQKVISVLFGWIDFKWIKIDNIESHILILMFVILSAKIRSEFRYEYKKGKSISYIILGGVFLGFMHFLHALLPALLLPGWFGFFGAVVGMILTFYAVATDHVHRKKTASGQIVRNDMKGSIVVFVLLIVLNYTIFKV